MTWSIRLKLWGGILVVAALVFALTLLFNQRQSQVASVTASIDAPAATVGSSYGGVVTDLYVRQGEAVTAGDALFTLNSIQLQQDVGNGLKPVSTEAYTLDPASGTVTYKAVSNGYVASIDAEPGSIRTLDELQTIDADTGEISGGEHDEKPPNDDTGEPMTYAAVAELITKADSPIALDLARDSIPAVADQKQQGELNQLAAKRLAELNKAAA